MKKRILTLMLALVMLLGAIPQVAATDTAVSQIEATSDTKEARYHDAIVLQPSFIGTSWEYGSEIRIPFKLYAFGNSGERYRVRVYDSNYNLLASKTGYFPSTLGITDYTLTWNEAPGPGTYYVQFESSHRYEKTDDNYNIFFVTGGSNSSTSTLNGWRQSNNGTWFYYVNGETVSGWQQISGIWYYFDSTGQMLTGWQNLGAWYYLCSDGSMATGWLNSNGTWYYLYSDGAMATGWLNLNGIWYYLYSDGAMATGWLNLNGTWYYLYSDGAMATGWLNLNGTWYYLNSDGAMLTGTHNIHGTTYSFDSSGAWIA